MIGKNRARNPAAITRAGRRGQVAKRPPLDGSDIVPSPNPALSVWQTRRQRFAADLG
jgi:hypothetical protein